MNGYKYVEEAEAKKVNKRVYANTRKQDIKRGICEFYRRNFLDYLNGNESVEELDRMNRATIKDIVTNFQSDLSFHFDGNWKNCYTIVRGILISSKVYKATAYTKTLDKFYMRQFAKDYLPEAVFQIWCRIVTDKSKHQALIDYSDSLNDCDTVDFLNEVEKSCRIV